jgi:hypothetical protein
MLKTYWDRSLNTWADLNKNATDVLPQLHVVSKVSSAAGTCAGGEKVTFLVDHVHGERGHLGSARCQNWPEINPGICLLTDTSSRMAAHAELINLIAFGEQEARYWDSTIASSTPSNRWLGDAHSTMYDDANRKITLQRPKLQRDGADLKQADLVYDPTGAVAGAACTINDGQAGVTNAAGTLKPLTNMDLFKCDR